MKNGRGPAKGLEAAAAPSDNASRARARGRRTAGGCAAGTRHRRPARAAPRARRPGRGALPSCYAPVCPSPSGAGRHWSPQAPRPARLRATGSRAPRPALERGTSTTIDELVDLDPLELRHQLLELLELAPPRAPQMLTVDRCPFVVIRSGSGSGAARRVFIAGARADRHKGRRNGARAI